MTGDGTGDGLHISGRCETLRKEAEASGYHLNGDESFVRELAEGLMANEKRYGYPSCPCRLASGDKEDDLDIICPCDYRDSDLDEYGACFCALYVSRAALDGSQPLGSIPERRPAPDERKRRKPRPGGERDSALPYPVWRCKVCGYLCARDEPPESCPICKAKKERFERFL